MKKLKRQKICKVYIKGALHTVFRVGSNSKYYGRISNIKKEIELTDDQLEETILHELMHAYFFECGATKYCNDENLHTIIGRCAIEIIKNYHKILKAFKECK